MQTVPLEFISKLEYTWASALSKFCQVICDFVTEKIYLCQQCIYLGVNSDLLVHNQSFVTEKHNNLTTATMSARTAVIKQSSHVDSSTMLNCVHKLRVTRTHTVPPSLFGGIINVYDLGYSISIQTSLTAIYIKRQNIVPDLCFMRNGNNGALYSWVTWKQKPKPPA